MPKIVHTKALFERLPAHGGRRFREVIVFVHHYGGNRHSFHRQIEVVNELGFDAVTFDLPASSVNQLPRIPLSREWRFGLRHLWADKIEDVLDTIADEKFVFSFSYGSSAALMAIDRRHAIDIRGWICDGGPFKYMPVAVEHFVNEGLFNIPLLGRDLIARNPLFRFPVFRRSMAAIASELFGRARYNEDGARALRALPRGFPVLSFQAENDTLVQPHMIDEFLAAGFGHIDLQKSLLPHSRHLTGMKDDADTYKSLLEGFLLARATPLVAS